jgi:hypothetical protein
MDLLTQYAQIIADNCRLAGQRLTEALSLNALFAPRDQVMTTVLVNVQTKGGRMRTVRARVMNNGRIVIGKDIIIGNLKRGA